MLGVVEVENGLYRGPALSSYADARWLVGRYGIKTVVNLQVGLLELAVGRKNDELRWVSMTGARLIDLDFPGLPIPPSSRDMNFLIDVLASPSMRPLYVHCRHGRERTGFAVAAFEVATRGVSIENAYQGMIEHGIRWPWSWIYRRELSKYKP